MYFLIRIVGLRATFRGGRLSQHQTHHAAVLTGFQNAFCGLRDGQWQDRRTVFYHLRGCAFGVADPGPALSHLYMSG